MRRHPLDPFSLIFGIVFAAVGGVLLDTDVDVTDLSGAWFLPLPLLLFGLVLLGMALTQVRERPIASTPGDQSDNSMDRERGDHESDDLPDEASDAPKGSAPVQGRAPGPEGESVS